MHKKILLVDDDAAVRQMLMRLLIEEGYTVLPAENGDKALKQAAATPIDLVLLDLTLPGQSGWDVFERLTTDYPLLPVIIITARPNQLFLAVGAGAGALFEKPLDFPKLLQSIRSLLSESVETRLARLAGRATEFHYLPKQNASRKQGPPQAARLRGAR